VKWKKKREEREREREKDERIGSGWCDRRRRQVTPFDTPKESNQWANRGERERERADAAGSDGKIDADRARPGESINH
jgi:hypothetical protein